MANVKNRDKKPLAGTKPLLLTSVRQSLSPRAPSLWSHLALLLSPRGHGHIPGQGFAGCWGHCAVSHSHSAAPGAGGNDVPGDVRKSYL